MTRIDLRDVAAGLFICLVGAAFVFGARSLGFGSARNMGPGFFPTMVGLVTIGLGLVILVFGLTRAAARIEIEIRPAAVILVAVLLFAVLIANVGFLPAAFAAVLVASHADERPRLLPTLVLAAATAVAVWLLFAKILGLPLPAFRGTSPWI